MKARPILMSGPMVRALLDGRKTQTRRIIKPQPEVDQGWEEEPHWALEWKDFDDGFTPEELARLCPYGQPGDLLWVRENVWQTCSFVNDSPPETGCTDLKPIWSDRFAYPADGGHQPEDMAMRPSIHMSRRASRLTLELIAVRVERLQDISEDDARAEGLKWHGLYKEWGGVEDHPASRPDCPQWRWYEIPTDAYRGLWETINGHGSWAANPWIWVIEFRVYQQNVDVIMARRAA